MKLQPHALTYIAENLGKRSPPPLRWLCVLAHHPSAVVREGVVYGLAPHACDPVVRGVLIGMSMFDGNRQVRNAANEALE